MNNFHGHYRNRELLLENFGHSLKCRFPAQGLFILIHVYFLTAVTSVLYEGEKIAAFAEREFEWK